MALQTEAECLLDTGGSTAFASCSAPSRGADLRRLQARAFSLYYGDGPIYHFDREGRWQRIHPRGIHYLKGSTTRSRRSIGSVKGPTWF